MTYDNTVIIPRVRFAPAPTGLMHLGNVRAALMNYIFARQKRGSFVIRIEDTDAERNYDRGALQILSDLAWLDLTYDEGPGKNGAYGPYFQSERTSLYREKLQELIAHDYAYRCFCTTALLEKKERQIALKQPPRYDRACASLSAEIIADNLQGAVPFVWRIRLPKEGDVAINDIARGVVHFNLKNFSDTPLTRQDGTFTFLFANFVDDMLMRISHIFRGEDHITNTAIQSIMYQIFKQSAPTYWHMPIVCNIDGRKLSKRDFGFSLSDLRAAGYLPEAICNYLAIIGGSFKQEIMSLEELARAVDFGHISKAGQIKYDVEKLTWINQSWIKKLDIVDLASRCMPFIKKAYPERVIDNFESTLITLIKPIQSDLLTLKHSVEALKFYFEPPVIERALFAEVIPDAYLLPTTRIVHDNIDSFHDFSLFNERIKKAAKESGVPFNHLFAFLRIALTGHAHGLAVNDLVAMIGKDEALSRLKNALRLFV